MLQSTCFGTYMVWVHASVCACASVCVCVCVCVCEWVFVCMYVYNLAQWKWVLRSLDAPELHASSDVSIPISLSQADPVENWLNNDMIGRKGMVDSFNVSLSASFIRRKFQFLPDEARTKRKVETSCLPFLSYQSCHFPKLYVWMCVCVCALPICCCRFFFCFRVFRWKTTACLRDAYSFLLLAAGRHSPRKVNYWNLTKWPSLASLGSVFCLLAKLCCSSFFQSWRLVSEGPWHVWPLWPDVRKLHR